MLTPNVFAAFSRALRNPNFGVYTAGNAISLIGTWIQRVAVGWLAWELTRSGFWLGMLALSDAVFTLLIGFFAGAAADRWDRLRITKAGQWVSLLQAFALFLLTATGAINMPLLLLLTAVLGICSAFIQPARHALVPLLVPASDLPVAVAINSVVFNLTRFIGPAIAGLLIAWVGISAAFAANAASFAAFLFALGRLRIGSNAHAAGPSKTFASDLLEGIRYVATHAGVGPLLALLVVTSTAGRAVAELLPAFSDLVFGAGSSVLAALTSSMGAGAIAAGVWLGGRSDPLALTRVVLAGVLILGLALMGFTATDRLWVGIPALVVAGGCMTLIGVGIQTLIFLAVPNTISGRALSIYGLIIWGGPGLGALLIGTWADALGFRLPLFMGGVIIIVAWLWGFTRKDQIASAMVAPAPSPVHSHVSGGSVERS